MVAMTSRTTLSLLVLTTLVSCKLTIGDGTDDDIGDGDGDGDTDETGTSESDSGTDSTGDGDGDPTNPPPETCSEAEEGFFWCTHDEATGPEGSMLYLCMAGSWVESNPVMDESCVADGYDFAYGCVDNGTEVIFECGAGSGDPCTEASPVFCVDDDVIAYCQSGKETWDSCLSFCQEVGVEGVTYEYGECDDSVPEVACFCCDSGDPGCPI